MHCLFASIGGPVAMSALMQTAVLLTSITFDSCINLFFFIIII